MTFSEELTALVRQPTEDAINAFKSQYGMWFGFRAEPGAIVEQVSNTLESGYEDNNLKWEERQNEIHFAYGPRSLTLAHQPSFRHCYAEVHSLNSLLAPEYEIRRIAPYSDESVHCFLLASESQWVAANDGGDVGAVFERLSPSSGFRLGPLPGPSVWLAERFSALTASVLTRALFRGRK